MVQHGQHSSLGLSFEMNKTDTEVKTRESVKRLAMGWGAVDLYGPVRGTRRKGKAPGLLKVYFLQDSVHIKMKSWG